MNYLRRNVTHRDSLGCIYQRELVTGAALGIILTGSSGPNMTDSRNNDRSHQPLRVGAVNYLNSKPLIYGFDQIAHDAQLSCDLPSRLADSLACGRLDVALIPVFEFFTGDGYQIASDACVASFGPVQSVKLYFRTKPQDVRTLALDEGSRTSAALCRVLLAKRFELNPECEPLPIGDSLGDTKADAVLLIGDRAMQPLEDESEFADVWDLGEEWRRETGLPFVFAVWALRRGIEAEPISRALAECRDLGAQHLSEIAATEAPLLGLREDYAEKYLAHLRYRLDPEARLGLETFRNACESVGLCQPNTATTTL